VIESAAGEASVIESAAGEASVIELAAGDARAVIAPHRGAICKRLRIGGEELLYLDQATFDDPAKNVRGGIPVLFPIAGKPPAGSGLAQHGWARNHVWEGTRIGPASMECRLSHGGFDLLVTYALAERALSIDAQVLGTGPFQLGLHPYLACADKRAARIETNATRAIDNQTEAEVRYAPPDFENSQPDLRLLDHRESGTVLHRGSQPPVRLRFSPDFHLLVLWTQPQKPFVCVEPWTDRYLHPPQHLALEISV
jgi:galactose mutarotase-like enzyme